MAPQEHRPDSILFKESGPHDPLVGELTTELDDELDVMYPPEEGIRTPRRTASPSRGEDGAVIPDEIYVPAELVYLIAHNPESASATQDGSKNIDLRDTLGCIAFRPLPSRFFPEQLRHLNFAELTRMYVRPSARGTGLNRRLLAQLEKHASQVYGQDVFTLRTGYRQVPAIKMYKKAGYRECALFGPYIGKGPEDGGVSVCYEKTLTDK